MISYFEADTQGLEMEEQQWKEASGAFMKEVNGLLKAVQDMDVMWEGPVKGGMTERIRQACQLLQNQFEEIKQIAECMEYAKVQYEKMEENSCSYVSRIVWDA